MTFAPRVGRECLVRSDRSDSQGTKQERNSKNASSLTRSRVDVVLSSQDGLGLFRCDRIGSKDRSEPKGEGGRGFKSKKFRWDSIQESYHFFDQSQCRGVGLRSGKDPLFAHEVFRPISGPVNSKISSRLPGTLHTRITSPPKLVSLCGNARPVMLREIHSIEEPSMPRSISCL